MPSPWSGALQSGSMPRSRRPSSWAAEGPAMTMPSSRSQMETAASWRAGSVSPGNNAIQGPRSLSGRADRALTGAAAMSPRRPIRMSTPAPTLLVNQLIGCLLGWDHGSPDLGTEGGKQEQDRLQTVLAG